MGRENDSYLLAIARNVCMLTAKEDIQLQVVHISGKNNVVADILCWWYIKISHSVLYKLVPE